MAARAIWKGVIKVGRQELPAKLFSAVQDRSIHFRLLHKDDLAPVKQRMVDPASEEPVEYEEAKKAFAVSRSSMVVLEGADLEKLEPEPSRDIEVTRFVETAQIDHRWYERAYYLGPDQSTQKYFALAAAMEKRGREGVAKWVMRGKRYVGALRAVDGYLMLVALRHAEEIVDAEALQAPQGRALDQREIAMAEQLVDALSGAFDPAAFRDEYRERVLELVELKSKGHKPKVAKFRPKKSDDDKLDSVLAASVKAVEKRRASGGSR